MSSNLEKIIKIAAINSFNNDTVNTVLGYITDVSNNIADSLIMKGAFRYLNKKFLNTCPTAG